MKSTGAQSSPAELVIHNPRTTKGHPWPGGPSRLFPIRDDYHSGRRKRPGEVDRGRVDTRFVPRSFTPTTGVLWPVSQPGRGVNVAGAWPTCSSPARRRRFRRHPPDRPWFSVTAGPRLTDAIRSLSPTYGGVTTDRASDLRFGTIPYNPQSQLGSSHNEVIDPLKVG